MFAHEANKIILDLSLWHQTEIKQEDENLLRGHTEVKIFQRKLRQRSSTQTSFGGPFLQTELTPLIYEGDRLSRHEACEQRGAWHVHAISQRAAGEGIGGDEKRRDATGGYGAEGSYGRGITLSGTVAQKPTDGRNQDCGQGARWPTNGPPCHGARTSASARS